MSPHPLRDFVQAMTRLADEALDEATWLARGEALLRPLVAKDDWLPESCAEAGPGYRQYLLHCDPLERFSVVSFVWGVGARTPVHNHRVPGLVGMLRGEEVSVTMHPTPEGPLREGATDHLRPGEVVQVGSAADDLHWVANALADRPSISIHVYGGNIGAVERQTFDPATGAPKRFVSGYSNQAVPNLWDRSQG